MASVKIFSLVVRTLAKPIANTIKGQATEHESFKRLCIGLAQRMHRTEARLRMGLLNEEASNIKPLNDARAIQNGATTLAESFLFFVGAGLVLGETWRSSRKEGKRRDDVAERLERLEEDLGKVKGLIEGNGAWSQAFAELRQQNENIQRVLDTVVANGLKAGLVSLGHQEGAGDVLPLVSARRARDTDGGSIGAGSATSPTLVIDPPWAGEVAGDSGSGGGSGNGSNGSLHAEAAVTPTTDDTA